MQREYSPFRIPQSNTGYPRSVSKVTGYEGGLPACQPPGRIEK